MKNTIIILSTVRKNEEESTKEIFKKIIEKFCDSKMEEALKIGTPKQIPNQLLFALEVPKDNAINAIKELTFEGVSVIKNEPFIKMAVSEANLELQAEQANTLQRIKKEESLKQKLRRKGDYTVEELAYLRDWQLMLEVAINQSYSNVEKSRKIKELLPEVLDEFIEKETQQGTRSLGFTKSSIEKLVMIAENETLKRFHMMGSMRKAGEAVIEMCSMYPKDLIGDLIFLANSNTTVPYVNIKAFLTFYKIVSEDPEKYEYEILVALRHLNTRALDTVYLASVKLNPDEKILFDNGIEFFKERRKEL